MICSFCLPVRSRAIGRRAADGLDSERRAMTSTFMQHFRHPLLVWWELEGGFWPPDVWTEEIVPAF